MSEFKKKVGIRKKSRNLKKKVGIREKKSEFEKKEADISMALMGLRNYSVFQSSKSSR